MVERHTGYLEFAEKSIPGFTLGGSFGMERVNVHAIYFSGRAREHMHAR